MIEEKIKQILQGICKEKGWDWPKGVLIEEPPAGIDADIATNVPLQLARQVGMSPRQLAEDFVKALQEKVLFTQIEIAGPGFLNISLPDTWFAEVVGELSKNEQPPPNSEKIIVEYISANPTGPLHIGNARGGPIGETLARIYEKAGIQVHREFYVNDIGGQADRFAASVLHFYAKHFGIEIPLPEKGYPENVVGEVAQYLIQTEGDKYVQLPEAERLETLRVAAIDRNIELIKKTVARMGIQFDDWLYQGGLVESGCSAAALDHLKHYDATILKEGAIWLKNGVRDDDRETVLVKSNGVGTYFLDDIAYHEDKLVTRNFKTAIVVLGANHFGHIPRMQAALQSLGLNPERYQGVTYQQVQLKQDGIAIKMAKRDGNFVTADQVLDVVPREVFTYFLLSKSNDTHLDFDLQLASDTSERNPIYYIQYAHARIHSVLSMAAEKGIEACLDQNHRFSPLERSVLLWLNSYASCLQEIKDTFHTHLLPNFIYELATRFHHWYAHERILTDDLEMSAHLLAIATLVANCIADGLYLMNIEALKKM